MLKSKKLLAIICCSLAVAITGMIGVSAATESKNIDRDMTQSYSKNTNNGAGYLYYHVGSLYPYDDVFAYSQTYVTSGMTGYASVNLKATNNQISMRYSDTIVNNQYIRTPNAAVSGVDTAKNVRFAGSRTDGSNNYKGFNYYIY